MDTNTPTRKATITGLAVVGFIALVVLGLWLAIYAARYIPSAVDELGAAVGSIFGSEPEPSLSVVPTASTTIAFGDDVASSTTASAATTTTTSTATSTTPVKTVAPVTYYRTVENTYPTVGSTKIKVPTTYSGFPDLVVSIIDVGYIDSKGTFVADSTIGKSDELAAVILVTNIGTNKTGPWTIKVTVPTSGDATFDHTETMDSLEPNQPVYIDLNLSKGKPRVGTNDIKVVVDPNDKIAESKENNNEDSASITVK